MKIMEKPKPHKNKTENGEEISGYFTVTDELDLHGFFPEQVPEMVDEFIRNARALKLKNLRIIHGKGKSRLKYIVHQQLKSNSAIETFGDAPPESGGWGATVIILK